tara:strand:- start:44803 stop:46353 length:1551 start_codon:yes stop_codon:yes gene_type:complete
MNSREARMTSIELVPGEVSLNQLRRVIKQAPKMQLNQSTEDQVNRSRKVVDDLLKQNKVIYGVNTGFGKLAHKVISEDNLIELQHNLLRSHAVGTGEMLSPGITKAILFIKINSLAQGYSGTRWEIIQYLTALYHADILPMIPAKGSVGASGDLAPLAHLSLLLIGEGEAQHGKQAISGAQVLEYLKLDRLVLQPKEGLALINGTQVSTAILAYALHLTQIVFEAAMIAGSLSVCASLSSATPFDEKIHAIRRLPEQEQVAKVLRTLTNNPFENDISAARVQDPYSIRCQPQVMGSCLAVMRQCAKTLSTEINAVTDNPLIFSETQEILSGGNFHAEPIAFAADNLACAIAEIGNLSERRINLLCDHSLSGLPDFLMQENGLNSGYMMPHVTAAALCSENKIFAHPASVDNIPTSGNQEDHVSMATTAAYRLLTMVENVADIISIELMAACQGIDLLPEKLSAGILRTSYETVRKQVPFYDKDRFFAPDMRAIKEQLWAESFKLSADVESKIDVFN